MLEQRGVVDHGIQMAEVRHGARHQRAHRILVEEIGIQGGAVAGQFSAGGGRLQRLVVRVAVVHGHLPAGAGKRERDVAPQAAGRAGHQNGACSGRCGHSRTMYGS